VIAEHQTRLLNGDYTPWEHPCHATDSYYNISDMGEEDGDAGGGYGDGGSTGLSPSYPNYHPSCNHASLLFLFDLYKAS